MTRTREMPRGHGPCIGCGKATAERYAASYLCGDCRRLYVLPLGGVHVDGRSPGVEPGVVAFWRRWWRERRSR